MSRSGWCGRQGMSGSSPRCPGRPTGGTRPGSPSLPPSLHVAEVGQVLLLDDVDDDAGAAGVELPECACSRYRESVTWLRPREWPIRLRSSPGGGAPGQSGLGRPGACQGGRGTFPRPWPGLFRPRSGAGWPPVPALLSWPASRPGCPQGMSRGCSGPRPDTGPRRPPPGSGNGFSPPSPGGPGDAPTSRWT